MDGEFENRGGCASPTSISPGDNDLTLKAAALKLGFVTEAEFNRVVDPAKMVKPYGATELAAGSGSEHQYENENL